MTHPLLIRALLHEAIDAMDGAAEPLCRECRASFRVEGRTLCAACQFEQDEIYATLKAHA